MGSGGAGEVRTPDSSDSSNGSALNQLSGLTASTTRAKADLTKASSDEERGNNVPKYDGYPIRKCLVCKLVDAAAFDHTMDGFQLNAAVGQIGRQQSYQY